MQSRQPTKFEIGASRAVLKMVTSTCAESTCAGTGVAKKGGKCFPPENDENWSGFMSLILHDKNIFQVRQGFSRCHRYWSVFRCIRSRLLCYHVGGAV